MVTRTAAKPSKSKPKAKEGSRQQQGRGKAQTSPKAAIAPETKPAAQPKVGRPSVEFSQRVADQICALISTSTLSLGKILEAIEDAPGLTTVFKWLNAQPVFATDLARAREARADFLIDQSATIADESGFDIVIDEDGRPQIVGECVQRSRLRVETRLKLAAMLAPKKYGAKLDVTSDGKPIVHASDDELRQRAFDLARRNGALAPAPGGAA